MPEEVKNGMDDFQGNKEQEAEDNFDWQKSVESMNEDQRRIFDSVLQSVKDGNKICRHFVTAEAGTEKSYVIKCLVHTIRQELKKDIAPMNCYASCFQSRRFNHAPIVATTR